jgi:hypothetical protein
VELIEAFPFDSAPEYPIIDRGSNFSYEAIDTVKGFGSSPTGLALSPYLVSAASITDMTWPWPPRLASLKFKIRSAVKA